MRTLVYEKGKIREVFGLPFDRHETVKEWLDSVDYLLGRMEPNYPVPAIPYVVDISNYDGFIPVYNGITGDIVACYDEDGYSRCHYINS